MFCCLRLRASLWVRRFICTRSESTSQWSSSSSDPSPHGGGAEGGGRRSHSSHASVTASAPRCSEVSRRERMFALGEKHQEGESSGEERGRRERFDQTACCHAEDA